MGKYAKTLRKDIIQNIRYVPCVILNESNNVYTVQFADGIKAFRVKKEVKLYQRTPKYVINLFANTI